MRQEGPDGKGQQGIFEARVWLGFVSIGGAGSRQLKEWIALQLSAMMIHWFRDLFFAAHQAVNDLKRSRSRQSIKARPYGSSLKQESPYEQMLEGPDSEGAQVRRQCVWSCRTSSVL